MADPRPSYSVSLGDFGELTLDFDGRHLGWDAPEHPLGDQGGWSGVVDLLCGSINGRCLTLVQVETLLRLVFGDEAPECIHGWGHLAVRDLPSPAELRADERADEEDIAA